MAKEVPVLKAVPRDRIGSRYAKRLRTAGRLPAVVYGHGSVPMSVSLCQHETLLHLKKGEKVFTIDIEGQATETCLVKDLQFGFLGDNVIHVDLTRVNLDEFVNARIHLDFAGSPEGAKKTGTIVVHMTSEIVIRCKVRDMPDSIRVDVSTMGDVLTVGQIKLPAGIEAVTPGNTMLVQLQTIAEVAVAEAATGTGATAPEVLTAKKDDEASKDAKAPAGDKKK